MRFIPILIFVFSFLTCLSQEKGKTTTPVTVRGIIGIPRTISSQMFRTSFSGVYEANLSLNARVFNNFFVGLGYQNSHFQNNKKVFVYYQVPSSQKTAGATLSYNTRVTGHGGFLKIGYDKFFDKGFVSYSLNAGYVKMIYSNVNDDTSKVNLPFAPKFFSAPYVQPEIAINFMADRSLTFSLIFSYNTIFYTFDPKAPRFAHIPQVEASSNNYMISWINIGFGFNVLIGKK
jgi:hypothetical protein